MQALPLALAALGAGYYALTRAERPATFADHATEEDLRAMDRWQDHMGGARFALAFGVGAGLLLWWTRRDEPA